MNPNLKNNENVMAAHQQLRRLMPSHQLLMQVMPSQEFQSMLPVLPLTAMSV